MKKFLNLLMPCLAISLMACSSSCSKTNNSLPIEPTAPSVSNTSCDETSCPAPIYDAGVTENSITQGSFKFTLPKGNWSRLTPPSDDVKVMLREPTQDINVALILSQTENSFDEYAVSVLRSFRESNVNFSTESITINDNPFIRATGLQDGILVMVWATVKNGYGYTFVCGNEISVPDITTTRDTCVKIGDSITID